VIELTIDRLGVLPIELHTDQAPATCAAFQELAESGTAGKITRAEPVAADDADCPPYGLIGASLVDTRGLLAKVEEEGSKKLVTRGSVCAIIGSSDFIISLTSHPGWELSMNVFGQVDLASIDSILTPCLKLPRKSERDPKFGTLMSLLDSPLRIQLDPLGTGSNTLPAQAKRHTQSLPMPPTPKSVPHGDEPPYEVRALHILVKHSGSRKPRSWRSGDKDITLSREGAIAKVMALRARLPGNAQTKQLREAFSSQARSESDCASAKRGGDLGPFVFAKMQRTFSECAYSLREYQVSGPVDTASGVHMIMRVPIDEDS
jgi:NIMA-interacting peptidyl-prolyl cis-trans isomerase 1